MKLKTLIEDHLSEFVKFCLSLLFIEFKCLVFICLLQNKYD